MSSPDTGRVYAIFSDALDLPEEERGLFIERACGGDAGLLREVRSLMASGEEAGSFLESGELHGHLEQVLPATDPLVGRALGRYRVLGIIARGGMGVVYRAEQEKPHRQVALKVLAQGLASPDLERRFEIEAEVLGRLHHPGIAQILEAGTFEAGAGPQPFFAMEHIDGLSLTVHADRGGLDVRARVELMIKICEAVHHAHQKGVIHRDLKPANILVERDGQPKVLDFGVARGTGSDLRVTRHTDRGVLIGTLPYMSPEQVRGNPEELDTRSDVYGLGVVCYELLTGALPHDLGERPVPDAIRMIAEETPRSLADAGRAFPADLETIVARALAPDRDRRYGSASELAADLRRFLDDEPIAARPPSTFYQVRKLVARNRLASTLIGGMAVLILGFGMAMAFQAARISAARDRAEEEAEAAREVSKFLQDVFRVPDPSEARGNTVTAREILDRGSERIREELGGRPRIQARLMGLMGNVYEGLGLPDRAERLLLEALETGRALPESQAEPVPMVEALVTLAWIHRSRGQYDEGVHRAREAVTLAEEALDPEAPHLVTALITLGVLQRDSRDDDEAAYLFRRAREIAERARGPEDVGVGTSLYHEGWLLHLQGKDEEALAAYERACPVLEAVVGDDHPQFVWCLNDTSVVLTQLGRLDEASQVHERVIAVRERILPPDHPDIAAAIDNLGSLLRREGDPEGAAATYRRALEMRERSLGPEHVDVARSLNNLGLVEHPLGRHEEAEAAFLRAEAIYRKTAGPDDVSLLSTIENRARLYETTGRCARAITLLEQTAGGFERSLGAEHLRVGGTLVQIGECLNQMGRYGDAQPILERSLAIGEKGIGEKHPSLTGVLLALGESLEGLGRLDEAALHYQRATDALEAAGRVDGWRMASTVYSVARLARRRGDTDRADALLERARAIREAAQGPDHASTLYLTSVSLANRDRSDEALETLRRALTAGFSPGIVDRDVDFLSLRDDPRLTRLLSEFRME